MKRIKFFLDFEKEEMWLNQMALQGYKFKGKFLAYRFHKTKSENTNIKIDYRTFENQTDFENYKALFEDSGWSHIAGSKSSGTQYFKKVSEEANDEIFSDLDSKAARYKRISKYYMTFVISYLPILLIFSMSGVFNVSTILNPKSFYFTPGLWEKTGTSFWLSFLFETPFALMRGYSWVILLLAYALSLIYYMLAEWQFKRVKKVN